MNKSSTFVTKPLVLPAMSVATAVRIPWARPFVDEEEIAAVACALRQRRLSIGAEVRAFEREVAALADRAYGVAVSNGTVALDVALAALDVGPGDEVIVPALSYIAGPNAVLRRGARPVFCDVDPGHLNVDPDSVAALVGPRTRAVLIAEYCGSPPDFDRLLPLCAEHGLRVVLDGAQSLLASHRGRPTLGLGHVATTSFHAAKALVCGEGGMVLTDDGAVAAAARSLRNQGEVAGSKYVYEAVGTNARLTELQAAIGRVQLRRADDVRARRRGAAARYDQALADIPEVVRLGHAPGAQSAWFSYGILVPHRDQVAARLLAAGIETRALYPLPAYRQPIPEYRRLGGAPCPVAEDVCARVLNLPLFYELEDCEVDEVVAALRDALDAVARCARE